MKVFEVVNALRAMPPGLDVWISVNDAENLTMSVEPRELLIPDGGGVTETRVIIKDA